MNRKIKIFLASVLVFFAILIIAITSMFNSEPSLKPIKKLQDYSFEIFYPQHLMFDSKSLDGEYYMVNFMASWCGHCIEEISYINSLKTKIPVKYIAIVVSDSEDNIKELFKYMKNPFDMIGFANQFVSYNFGNFSLPQNFIVNKKGEIIFKHTGVISKAQFEEQIIPFLDEAIRE